MIDCCPFSVLVRLIAHEVSGGWKDYRNRNALKKAEVECVPSRFRGCFSYAISVEVAGKPFCIVCMCVSVCVFEVLSR